MAAAARRRRHFAYGVAAAIALCLASSFVPVISAQRSGVTQSVRSSSSGSSNTAAISTPSGGNKACASKSGDPACVKCTKSKSKTTCIACSSAGAVPAEIGAKGRCVCPAGSAASTGAASSKSVGTAGPSSSSKSSSKSSFSKSTLASTCNPCAVNYYAPSAQPVTKSKCKRCPEGTTTQAQVGSTTCYALPGTYFDPATQTVYPCPVNEWCQGGDITESGRAHVKCPTGSGTQNTENNVEESDCVVPPGRLYDPAQDQVIACPKDFYCQGGHIGDGEPGQTAEPCPGGTTTASSGASQEAQCTVPPGSVYNPTTQTISTCLAASWCPGGSVSTTGTQQIPCEPGTTSLAGASKPSDCTPTTCPPGYYTLSTQTVPLVCVACGANYVCPGSPDPTVRTPCALGTDTAGLTTASLDSQCVVSTCNPCGTTATPTTYFTTGSSRQVYVNAALDPTTATNPPTADLVCTMPTDTPEFTDTSSAINDVAATSTGKLLIAGRPTSSNAAGFILLLDPVAQTPSQPCTYTKLLDIAPAVAGLGAGPKSNLFFGTGGSAFVYSYSLSEVNGVVSLTPVGTADVSTTIGGAIGASDITAVPNDPTKAYFTSGTVGYVISLDSNGNPIAGTEQQLVSRGIGLSAPAAWCNSVSAFAGSSSTDNAYTFAASGGAFTNVGETTMPVAAGLSGAATVPVCA